MLLPAGGRLRCWLPPAAGRLAKAACIGSVRCTLQQVREPVGERAESTSARMRIGSLI